MSERAKSQAALWRVFSYCLPMFPKNTTRDIFSASESMSLEILAELAKIVYTLRVNEKEILIIGHKNPDTDSIVSATAYAAFKQAQGIRNCRAIRAGKPTPQTEYIFNRFGVPLPDFIPDLIPKAEHYYKPGATCVSKNTSLKEAMALLSKTGGRVLPVVGNDGKYLSLLHYSAFAQEVLKMMMPKQKTVIMTSGELLANVLNAQPLILANGKEIRKSPVIVAAAVYDTFVTRLNENIPENTIVIVGNRKDIQRHIIESRVRIMIITSGHALDKELREMAEKNGVTVLISPYDTASTVLLLIYSMPVSCVSNRAVEPVRKANTIKKIEPLLAAAPGKTLPVLDEDDNVVGLISESDLFDEPNIDLILVDHNEITQAIEGADQFRILEIIDHHRLGSVSTRYPITFINKPVGATCTIITELYQQSHTPIKSEIASILLCGILADTLALQSATTTDEDRRSAEFLSDITNLDIDVVGKEVLTAASNVSGRAALDIISQDMKVYNEGDYSFSVSQIEVESPEEITKRKKEFIDILDSVREKNGRLFTSLLVTDITRLTSILLISAPQDFLQAISLPKDEDNIYPMKDIVSRKKQLMPILSEVVENYSRK